MSDPSATKSTISNAASSSAATATPGRNSSNNNYAAPHTPIASAKRPRSSNAMLMSPGAGSATKNRLPSTPLVGGTGTSAGPPSLDLTKSPTTPIPGIILEEGDDALDATATMSPMHPPRPLVAVGKDGTGANKESLKKILEQKALLDPGLADDAQEAQEGSADPDKQHDSDDPQNWVGRQVDALFSPVLSFLGNEDDEEGGRKHGEHHHHHHQDGKENHPTKSASASDSTNSNFRDDVSMEDASSPKQKVINAQTSDTQETTSYDDDEDEDEEQHNEQAALAHAQKRDKHHKEDDDGEEEDDHEGHHSPEEIIEDDASRTSSVGEDDEDEFNPYVFIKCLPAYEIVKPLRPPIALPPKSKNAPPVSLVLDLDETLVHCTVEPVDDADLIFPVVFHGMTYQVHVRLRPHLFTFLEKIKGKYEVTVFTASQKVYANELLNLIDPEGKYFHHRMFRESCLAVEGNFLKDLTVLGRDLSKTVLVDNSPHAFGYQMDNGIPIESWFDDPNDTELLKLERFLRTLRDVDDVRTVVRQKFQTFALVENA